MPVLVTLLRASWLLGCLSGCKAEPLVCSFCLVTLCLVLCPSFSAALVLLPPVSQSQVDSSEWLLVCALSLLEECCDVALGYRQSGGVLLPHLAVSLCCTEQEQGRRACAWPRARSPFGQPLCVRVE